MLDGTGNIRAFFVGNKERAEKVPTAWDVPKSQTYLKIFCESKVVILSMLLKDPAVDSTVSLIELSPRPIHSALLGK